MAKHIDVILTLQDRFSGKMSAAGYKALEFKRNMAIARGVSDSFATAMHKMETIALTATTAAAGAAVAFVKAGLETYEEFNRKANTVAGIQGIKAQTEAYKKLTETIKENARQVKGIDYGQAADAKQYMALAGWNEEMQKNAYIPLLRALRMSGESDTKTVADLLTDSMSALKLTTEKTEKYIDVCTAIQAAANVNIAELQKGYITTGPGLQALGVAWEDTGAMLGILGSNGLKGSQGGNVLKSIYARMVKSGGTEAQRGLKSIGVSPYDEAGKFKRPEILFGDIAKGLENLNEEERNSALSLIGGTRQYSALQNLIDGFTKKGESGLTLYEELTQAIKNSDGAAEQFVETMNSGYSGAKEVLGAEWYNFKADAGEILAPYAVKALQWASEKLPEIKDWIENKLPGVLEAGEKGLSKLVDTVKPFFEYIIENKETILKVLGGAYIGMGAFRAVVGTIDGATSIARFANGINKQKAAKAKIAEKAAEAAATAGTAGTAATAAKAATAGTAATAVSIGEVLGIVAAIAAVAATLYSAYRNSEKLRDAGKSAAEKFGDFFARIKENLPYLTDAKDAIFDMFEAFSKATGDILAIPLNGIDKFMAFLVPFESTIIQENIKDCADAMSFFATNIKGVVEAVDPKIVEVLEKTFGMEHIDDEKLARIGETAGEVFGKLSQVLATGGFITNVWTINTAVEMLGNNFIFVKDKLQDFVTKASVGCTTFETAFKGKVIRPVQTVVDWIKKALELLQKLLNIDTKKRFIQTYKGEFGLFSSNIGAYGFTVDDAENPFLTSGYRGEKGAYTAAAGAYGVTDDDIGQNALGSNYWKGGQTTINERGGEIIDLPRGSRIIPNDISRKMAASNGGKPEIIIIINIENFYGEDEKYLENVANVIGHKLAAVIN